MDINQVAIPESIVEIPELIEWLSNLAALDEYTPADMGRGDWLESLASSIIMEDMSLAEALKIKRN